MKTKNVYLIVLSFALGLVLLLIIDNLTNASITSFLANYDIFTTLAILPFLYPTHLYFIVYFIYLQYGLFAGIFSAVLVIVGILVILYIIYKNSPKAVKSFVTLVLIPILIIQYSFSLFAVTSGTLVNLRNKKNLEQIGNAINRYNTDPKNTTKFNWKLIEPEKRNNLTPLVPDYLKFIPEPYGKTSRYYIQASQSSDYICISYKSPFYETYCYDYTTKKFDKKIW